MLMARAQLGIGSRRGRLESLLVAARRLGGGVSRRVLRTRLEPYLATATASIWRSEEVGWKRYRESFGGINQRALTTSLLLKAPGPDGEKGVLYSSFEYNWMRIVANHDARRFFSRYLLVGASSWSPPDYASFANLAGLSTDPIFIGISNHSDIAAYRLFEPTIRAVPLMACDWINPERYEPKPFAQREIDILMVANWLPFKRHWLLFEALRNMNPRLRVVLIGRNGGGRTENDIRMEAKAFGVRQELELLTNVDADEVTRYQCNARIATLLSDREGSCVAVAEHLFADTPVAMMRDAHVGAKAHINMQTGSLMKRGEIAAALEELLDRPARLAPRAWASKHITCQQSSQRLNTQLREYCIRAGSPWTKDIRPLEWRYVPTYLNPGDADVMKAGIAQLREEFGIELTQFIYRKHRADLPRGQSE
jgi:glycosyltransferase involved in cell wall biosynthesis